MQLQQVFLIVCCNFDDTKKQLTRINLVLMDISQERKEYNRAKLNIKSVLNDPISQFNVWLEEAFAAKCLEPTAMTVCTVSNQNTPAGRVVLLKGVEEGKFVFFTNYKSRKGQHLADNPNIGAVFFWRELERQVNIEGSVEKCSVEASDIYFNSRPWKSRIGAIISPQSQPIKSRNEIKSAFVRESAKYLGRSVPRPQHWGGYQIIPHRIEFWQGRPSRLHDRILYTINSENKWETTRLAP